MLTWIIFESILMSDSALVSEVETLQGKKESLKTHRAGVH